VLGPGAFFGERGLADNRPRMASIRARTKVEVLVVGKTAFGQMSKTLSPLRDAISSSIQRRDADPWKDQPVAQAVLASHKVRDILEPAPEPFLNPSDTLEDVNRAFISNDHEVFYVSSDDGKIEGVVTMTDLIRAQAIGLAHDTPVKKFMVANPVSVSIDDALGVAANVFRDHGIKTLPVVDPSTGKLAGCLRARRLMALLIENVQAAAT